MHIDPKKSKNRFIFFHLTCYIWEGSSMFHPLGDGVGISLSPIAGKKALSEALKEGSFFFSPGRCCDPQSHSNCSGSVVQHRLCKPLSHVLLRGNVDLLLQGERNTAGGHRHHRQTIQNYVSN